MADVLRPARAEPRAPAAHHPIKRLLIFVHHCVYVQANTHRLDGLPSWWPFWRDSVKSITRELVQQARVVAKPEGREL